jgi:hypothetical protein
MYRRTLQIIALALALATLFVAAPAAGAQDSQRCFPETGQCIGGRIREHWEQNGGLPVFGFPTTDQHEEQVQGRPRSEKRRGGKKCPSKCATRGWAGH